MSTNSKPSQSLLIKGTTSSSEVEPKQPVKFWAILPLLGALWFFFASISYAGNQTRTQKFLKNLQSFCAIEKMSYKEIQEIMFDITMNGRFLAKAGVGVIGNGCYILLNRSRNTISIKGKIWSGSDRSQRQIVFINDGKVHQLDQTPNVAQTTMLIFEPSEVRIVDFSGKKGGIYKR